MRGRFRRGNWCVVIGRPRGDDPRRDMRTRATVHPFSRMCACRAASCATDRMYHTPLHFSCRESGTCVTCCGTTTYEICGRGTILGSVARSQRIVASELRHARHGRVAPCNCTTCAVARKLQGPMCPLLGTPSIGPLQDARLALLHFAVLRRRSTTRGPLRTKPEGRTKPEVADRHTCHFAACHIAARRSAACQFVACQFAAAGVGSVHVVHIATPTSPNRKR